MLTTKLSVLMGSVVALALLAGTSGSAQANPFHHGGAPVYGAGPRPVYVPPAAPVYQRPVYGYQQPVYAPPAPVYGAPVYGALAYGYRHHAPVYAPVFHRHHHGWR